MALNDDIAFLAQQSLLGLMGRGPLGLVGFPGGHRMRRAGDVLFRRNDGSDGAYLVVSGAIALMSRDDGQPADEVVGPGGLIGELALFASIKRPVTAVAREPTQLMKLSRSVMRRVLGESPQSAQAIAAAIGERLQGFMGELSQVRDALIAIDRS